MIYIYSIHIRNADIVLIYVYMYNIYTVFLLLFITGFFTVLFYIVKLNIIFVYYQFYLLCRNKDYYYNVGRRTRKLEFPMFIIYFHVLDFTNIITAVHDVCQVP